MCGVKIFDSRRYWNCHFWYIWMCGLVITDTLIQTHTFCMYLNERVGFMMSRGLSGGKSVGFGIGSDSAGLWSQRVQLPPVTIATNSHPYGFSVPWTRFEGKTILKRTVDSVKFRFL